MPKQVAAGECLIVFLWVAILSACSSHPFEVADVKFYTNYTSYSGGDTLTMESDLDAAVVNGIEIPSKLQSPNGFFNFQFKLKNTSGIPQRFYYKIYYQNESYKFPDSSHYAAENFYGSWQDAELAFISSPELLPNEEALVKDSFKISGNPRDELTCFGSDPSQFKISDSLLVKKRDFILNTPDWKEKVKQNALLKKISVEDELYQNTLWLINEERQKEKKVNNRWKRNPRMGVYKIMLVVVSGKDLVTIPYPVQNIAAKNDSGLFQNPFSYFSSTTSRSKKETLLFLAPPLKVKSIFNLGSGIFQDPFKNLQYNPNKENYCASCGDNDSLYYKAQFCQYFHYVNKDFVLRNIPLARDVVGDLGSREEYINWTNEYSSEKKRTSDFVSTSKFPCKTVIVDKQNRSLVLTNPASKNGAFKKEHVGVSTRIGFTYGKFRARIKFPKQLSKDNVWNGITNAFWLLFQGEGEWNKRRVCAADIGYIEKDLPDEDASLSKSKKSICYSEIDIEILKEIPYWPPSSYLKSNVPFKTEDGTSNHNIMVCCTNWDMACHEPKKFSIGAQSLAADGNSYLFNRWNHFSKALTAKIPVDHDEIYSKSAYYFEIEWLPEKIIWKIGPEKSKMKTICVMTDEFSSIPNNQMVMMFTQEWHNQEWWPTAPFKQNFVPYPAKDIVGEILEVEVE